MDLSFPSCTQTCLSKYAQPWMNKNKVHRLFLWWKLCHMDSAQLKFTLVGTWLHSPSEHRRCMSPPCTCGCSVAGSFCGRCRDAKEPEGKRAGLSQNCKIVPIDKNLSKTTLKSFQRNTKIVMLKLQCCVLMMPCKVTYFDYVYQLDFINYTVSPDRPSWLTDILWWWTECLWRSTC